MDRILYSVFIPGNVPSSKNSKRWTGRFLISSDATQRYKRDTHLLYLSQARAFRRATLELPKPLKIGFEFKRKTSGRFDYHNLIQCPADMMVEAGWIDDDCATEMLPVFLPFSKDKDNPGVWIYILE